MHQKFQCTHNISPRIIWLEGSAKDLHDQKTWKNKHRTANFHFSKVTAYLIDLDVFVIYFVKSILKN